MKRWLVLLLGITSYFVFLGVFLYAIGFIGNLAVPRGLDAPIRVPVGLALPVDLGLLALFALQHSVMARGWFKREVHRLVPAAAERSLYVMATNVALVLLFVFWQPIGPTLWNVTRVAGQIPIWSLYAAGWLTVLTTTFLINHFDLFGLRQTWCYFRGRECRPLGFVTPGPYRWVRHPLYVGWILVFWSTPLMTLGHLTFAVGTTLYILVAIIFEERNLLSAHGEEYARYRNKVPMLIPRVFGPQTTEDKGALEPRSGPASPSTPLQPLTHETMR